MYRIFHETKMIYKYKWVNVINFLELLENTAIVIFVDFIVTVDSLYLGSL